MADRKIIIANWKMRLDITASMQLIQDVFTRMQKSSFEHLEIVVCPSYDSLAAVSEYIGDSEIGLGAQDVFWQERGAYTGEISASMLRALGVSLVIIGHSERRKHNHETDEIVNNKIKAAGAQDLVPVLCVGETYEERSKGHTDLIIMRQVIEGLKGIPLEEGQKLIIAYEPVWVIGTGQAIEPPMVEHASEVINQALIELYSLDTISKQIRIIYGGSVDESNIAAYLTLPKIEGALVGTASVNPDKFVPLLKKL